MVRRLARDDQTRSDLGIAPTVEQQGEDVELPVGQSGRVGAGGGRRTTGNPRDPESAQPPSDHSGDGAGVQRVEQR
jgi:hypothetical protein